MKIKSGFTIAEVLIVIAIIAILTTLILPSMNDIRKKNRDTERISDITNIQLGLSLYSGQATSTQGYPLTLQDLVPKYTTADSLVSPDGTQYTYIPLKRAGSPKCVYYHLGTTLELTSAQIDAADTFSSAPGSISNGYSYCDVGYSGPGLVAGTKNFNVHP